MHTAPFTAILRAYPSAIGFGWFDPLLDTFRDVLETLLAA
jgi:hypothetical protein